jgi:hypothetical protein
MADRMMSLDHRETQLSCQQATLLAKAAGAQGLQEGEAARAAALAAEAGGLKVRCVLLLCGWVLVKGLFLSCRDCFCHAGQ